SNAYGVITSFSATQVAGGTGYTGTTGATTSWTPSSYTYDWVILSDNAATSATRRFQLWTFNRTVNTPNVSPWGFVGFITCTIPFAGTQNTYLNRGHQIVYN